MWAVPVRLFLTTGPGRSPPGFRTVIRRPVRLVAVCLALVGQVVGTFGLPVARGSAETPNAPCGCSLADHTAGRCCCHHDQPAPADDPLPPCCRGKKAPPAVTWVVPVLRSKCQGPHDMVPESVVPTSIPPGLPIHWTVTADEAGTVLASRVRLRSHVTLLDAPPPRS